MAWPASSCSWILAPQQLVIWPGTVQACPICRPLLPEHQPQPAHLHHEQCTSLDCESHHDSQPADLPSPS